MFDFKKMKGKEVEKGSPEYEAHKKVLSGIKKSAEDKIADGIKKVTVASDSEEGVKEGLEKAKEIVDAGPEKLMEEAMGDEESLGSEVEEVLAEVNSEEEIEELMKKLEAKKAKLQAEKMA